MGLKTALKVLAFFVLRDNIADAAYAQGSELDYLANFDSIQSATYSSPLPNDLSNTCRDKGYSAPVNEVSVQAGTNGVVNSADVSNQCGDSKCIIPMGTTFRVDKSVNLAALVVKGVVEWTDSTQIDPTIFMCAGYIAIEEQGKWEMDLQTSDAFIYIKDNGAVHDSLRTRAFGGAAISDMDYPIIDINGRELRRPWSLLSHPLKKGQNTMKLMHNPKFMGWKIGDRIGVAPTEVRAEGHGEEFVIGHIEDDGSIVLDKLAEYDHDAEFKPASASGHHPPLFTAEVVNLSRNIVITGDDLKHIDCDSSLPEAVLGEETSTIGCRCSSYRSKCTIGLHTAIMHGGTAKIQNTRIEKCGQRGVEGKYCLHFHKLHDCPTCLFKNNAIEGGHQRGIIVHGTHSSTVENNVLYNVRGAGIYIEDGNEMYNDIKYNVVICPFPFADAVMNGCTVPGTSNRLSDTSDNHSGIYSRAFTNSLQGNRVANLFNGMFFNAEGIGRGESYDKVCEADAKFTRIEGNTFHGNGRFGTYVLGFNFPKATDQSILNDGHNVDKSLCSGFDENGYDRGLPSAIIDNLDYGNAFVGHYNAGDIQYNGHTSHNNIELIYWKTTKNFANGCSAHITGGDYSHGNMALPDQATFLIEDTVFGDQVSLEANHHCNEGTTGVLCFPQYLFHNVVWKRADMSNPWVRFQYGGVFSLSPPNAQIVMDGGFLDDSFFPPGFVSLVSSQYTYLLGLPTNPCVLSDSISEDYGKAFGGGILCKVPLRALKVYTKDLVPGSAPPLKVDVWYGKGGVVNQFTPPDSTQTINFHQTGSTRKQGYSIPVVPGSEHSYRLSLADGNGDIPTSWVVEFSDLVIGNRFEIEFTNLALNGRMCGNDGLISSHHDRRFIWSGDEFMNDNAWGQTGACSINNPQDFPLVDCSVIGDGKMDADECAELCNYECDQNSSYCDCGSAICKCKPGFSGDDCSIDVCSSARCEEHGTCTAKYLGGDLPVTSVACICDKGWSGPLCQFNPCQDSGKTCSGHGTCVAVSDLDAMCQCDPGYSGENCEKNCDDFCIGSYPFNCATSVDGIIKYGCDSNGGCMYLADGQEYPHPGFCTYKEVVQSSQCMCGAENECVKTQSCMPDGSCQPENLPDFSPCNAVPFGVCVGGKCLEQSATKPPTTQPRPGNPSRTPTSKPTVLSTSKPTVVSTTGRPTQNPTKSEVTRGTCDGFCIGEYPYGCASNLPGIVEYGCHQYGGCYYLEDGHFYPHEGFCTYKSLIPVSIPPPSPIPTSGPTHEPTNIPLSSRPTAKPTNQFDQNICEGVCIGDYPYGCATSLDGVVLYGCHRNGGCHYLLAGQNYPYEGFCTFKSLLAMSISPTQRPTSTPTKSPTAKPSDAANQYPCDGICIGDYPYGCATNLVDVVEYGCHHAGGCNYLKNGESYPYNGFCTYKSLLVQASQPTKNPISNPTPSPTPNPTGAINRNPCDGICIGDFPYGCATDLVDVVEYGCHHAGGCNYLKSGESYPYAGFCSFKKI